MTSPSPLRPTLALLLALAACGRRPEAEPAKGGAMLAGLPSAAPAAAAEATLPAADDAPQDTGDPLRFQPLRSAAVKDAIHQALRTGQTQRWADGALTGYAVPSTVTDARGCRAVRYTVDQRIGAAPESITACDAH